MTSQVSNAPVRTPGRSAAEPPAEAEDGANTSTLLAYSGHTSVASLTRYARVSCEALARWQAGRDPAARKR
ncbi:hypothetical protein ACIBF6_36370 [Streptosporangium amethystogenes]|uniref:hypothetical protein n=1 Tax=Streptosporangium amethystogenes TaxID=2002 RepID=UPI0037AE64F3